MTDCIFCDILAKKAPAVYLYEDQQCVVIKNIAPLAPTHLLILPRKHIVSVNELEVSDVELAGHLLLTAKVVAAQLGITDYRLAINTGRGAGQSVFHLHVHLLAGAKMDESLLSRGLA